MEREVDMGLSIGGVGFWFWLWLYVCMWMGSTIQGFIQRFYHVEVELVELKKKKQGKNAKGGEEGFKPILFHKRHWL